MRANTRINEKMWQLKDMVSPMTKKAKDFVTLGLSGKQWLSSLVICLLLLPVFSSPARASYVVKGNSSDVNKFEPVNEDLWFWDSAINDLSSKVEEWRTPMREVNVLYRKNGDKDKNGDGDDKKVVKRKGKKGEGTEKEKSSEKEKQTETSDEPTADDSEDEEEVTSEESVENTDEVETPLENKVEEEEDLPLEEEDDDDDEQEEEKLLKEKTVAPASDNLLPVEEEGSVYSAENNLGNPYGQVEKDSSNQAAVGRIRHRAGIANFSFGLPMASLTGRGIDAEIGMTYNSRTWNVSYNTNQQKHYTYDVDESWIAPGFSSGYGHLDSRATLRNVVTNAPNNDWHTEIVPLGLSDADGTRRQLSCKTFVPIYGTSQQRCSVYSTTDGTFIEFPGKNYYDNPNNSNTPYTGNYTSTSFKTTYPNGTQIWYSGGFGSGEKRKHYPLVIQDRNGNRIRITYNADETGKIDYITDTLNREIKFYYGTDSNNNTNKLVAVTVPGIDANEEIQTLRFYYENMALNSAGKFVGQITAPATIQVLKYVYMPSTKSGYKYEYHSNYGMIKKIKRVAGMSVSDETSLTTTGTVTSEGTSAATTEYNFPNGSTALTDVPKYDKRTDDWAGKTSSQPSETLYDIPTPSGGESISRITVKDDGFDVLTETKSNYGSGWDSGLVKETSVKKIYGPAGQFNTLMSRTKYFWQLSPYVGFGRRAPQLQKIEVTNEAGLTKATEYEYDSYNNQTLVKEYDYAEPGTLGTLLRTTDIDYEDGSGWIDKNIRGLTKSIKRTVDGVIVSKSEYEYDNSAVTRRDDIDTSTHDTYYNPQYPATTETICPIAGDSSKEKEKDSTENSSEDGCITIEHPGYDANSIYRGNVTKITNYSDATLATDSNADITHLKYDITGNIVESSLSCCQVRTYEYSKIHEYAFQISQTSGSLPTQLSTSATYNRNTGLLLTSTDENNQVTSYEYEDDTLREKKVNYPNGGYIKSEYSDKLALGTLPAFVLTTTSLTANQTVQNYSYLDGRGLPIRSASGSLNDWTISASEFDHLGRPIKNYNQFYASTPNGAIASGTKFTEVTGYDALGRTTSLKLQDDTVVSTVFSNVSTTPNEFDKTFVVATDQAGKQRRQVADALGRIVRVDEPDENGNLGAVDSPNQPTNYEYDGNDNLAKTIQTEGAIVQERLFKYDSLSRLTHERQVESTPTLDINGIKGAASPNKWTKVLKYNLDGLLAEGINAVGAKATFAYDGLNRLKTITYSGETGYQTPTTTYVYDEVRSGFYNAGRLTRLTTAAVGGTQNTPATEQVFDYDNHGKVSKQQQHVGGQSYLIEYGYNLAGQLISEKYPSGKTINVGYDTKGRLSNITDETRSYITGVSFNSKTLPSQINYGNGTSQTFEFNDRLQMTSQSLIKGTDVLQKYDYGFGQIDSNGNLDTTKNNGQLAKVESHIGSQKQWTQKFNYDSLGRLSEAKEYRGDTNALTYKQKFEFDNFGNLYRRANSNPTTGQENPIAFETIEDTDIEKTTNRFKSSTGTTYNDAGQVITDNKFRDASFVYDANGRMIKTVRANFADAKTVYDGNGNRVATKVNDVWQFIIYDVFGKMIAEYGDENVSDGGGVNYILQDYQGSPRAQVNNAGHIRSRTDYQAFGREIGSGIGLRTSTQGFGSGINIRPGYGQTEKDKASGLEHTWFRKLETQAGRWSSPDPFNGSINIGNPQSLNRYSYVENQPTNYIDPSGLLLIICRITETWTWTNTEDGPVGTLSTTTECTVFGGGTGPGWQPPVGPGGEPPGGPGEEPGENNDDQYKNCVKRQNKYFQGNKPTTPTKQQVTDYLKALGDAAEDFREAIAKLHRDFKKSVWRTVISTATGAALGAWAGGKIGAVGGPKGALAGALIGAVWSIAWAAEDKGIDTTDARNTFNKQVGRINRDNPTVFRFASWLQRYKTALQQCATDYYFRNRYKRYRRY